MTNPFFIPHFCCLQLFSTYKVNLLCSAHQNTHFIIQNEIFPNTGKQKKSKLDLQTKFVVSFALWQQNTLKIVFRTSGTRQWRNNLRYKLNIQRCWDQGGESQDCPSLPRGQPSWLRGGEEQPQQGFAGVVGGAWWVEDKIWSKERSSWLEFTEHYTKELHRKSAQRVAF